jgi:colanic acid biosynthesis glycosyl transferase WcaI
MKVLIITPIYLPEQAPISHLLADTVEGLVGRGHSVEIVTGIASWLLEGEAETSSVEFCVEKTVNGNIYRLPFVKRASNRLVDKLLGYFRLRILANRYKNRFSKPDVIYAPVPSNETGMTARALANYFNCPYVINVQDIHPDAVFNLGIVRNRILKVLLKNQEMRMYRDAYHITVIGESFKENLTEKGVLAPISVIPNWIKPNDYRVSINTGLSKEWGINDNKFVVLYSGTFGRIHGTSVILDAAERLLNDNNILFLLVGHGVDFDLIQEQAVKRKLQNVLMKEYVPRARLAELQSLSSISLVTLRAQLGYSSIPSKVLGYMAASRPVIAMTEKDSDVGKLVETAQCGLVLPPEDVSSLVFSIRQCLEKRQELVTWGANGCDYLRNHLDKEVLIDQIGNIFTKID